MKRLIALTLLCSIAAVGSTQERSQSRLLVSLSGEDKVLVLDPATGRHLQSFSVAPGPHEIDVERGGRMAYVASPGGSGATPGHAVNVLDLRGGSSSRPLDVAPHRQPHDVRVSSDGTVLWVACAPDRAVLELDVSDGTLRRKWDTGADGAWFLAVTPDDRKLFVPHLEGKQVTSIDRESGRALVVLRGGAQSGLDISPDGAEAWAIDHEQRRIRVVSTATDRVVAEIGLALDLFGRLRFTPDGRRVALVQGRTLSMFEVHSRRGLGTLDMPLAGKVIAVSPDSRRAAISNPADGRVTIVDLDAMRVMGSWPVGRGPDGVAWIQPPPLVNDMFPAWAPDGRRVVFTSDRDGDPEIYVVGLDGVGLRRLTRSPGRDAHPSFSPDGRQIAFQSPRHDGQTRLFLMNGDGSDQRQITANTGFCGVPVWSPDGRRLAFQCSASMKPFGTPEAPWRIYTLDLPGGEPVVRTHGPGNDQVPNWSPDGARLVFDSDRGGSDQLFSVDLSTGSVSQLTSAPGRHRSATYSPDGRQFVFIGDDGQSPGDVYLMNVDGTARRRLTTLGIEHGLPQFSPDGGRILFQHRDASGSRIWVMSATGTDPRVVDTSVARSP